MTSDDRAAAFIAHAAAEAAASESPTSALSRSPLRVASLHFVDGVQGAICSGMGVQGQPGQLKNATSTESSDRLGLTGVAVKERFRRAKRR